MPNLNLSVVGKELAKTRFRGFNLTLPAVGAAAGGGPHLRQSAEISALVSSAATRITQPLAASPIPSPPALFRAASSGSDDVTKQRNMHEAYGLLFDRLCEAIDFAFNMYKLKAGLRDVVIHGPVATGGRLDGPALEGLIKTAPQVAAFTGWMAMVRDAVASGMDTQWSIVEKSVRVPGLPWYPAFAAFPGPVAPPMPNIPMPFAVLIHDFAATTPESLKAAMRSGLQGKTMEFGDEFFLSLGLGIQTALQIWKGSQMVTLVMGKGSVPTFSPPYVPVGPVVNGDILPGTHLTT